MTWRALATAAGAGGVFGGLFAAFVRLGVNLGSLAEWTTGALTAGALYMGVRVLGREKESLDQQRRELMAAETRRRRDQARHVAAWVMSRSFGSTRVRGPKHLNVRYRLQNLSIEPIYDLHLRVEVLKEFEGADATPIAIHRNVLAPGGSVDGRGTVLTDLTDEAIESAGYSPDDVEIGVIFRDASGLYWMRDHLGVLRETPDYDPHKPWPDE